jgi:hypothetical protein
MQKVLMEAPIDFNNEPYYTSYQAVIQGQKMKKGYFFKFSGLNCKTPPEIQGVFHIPERSRP